MVVAVTSCEVGMIERVIFVLLDFGAYWQQHLHTVVLDCMYFLAKPFIMSELVGSSTYRPFEVYCLRIRLKERSQKMQLPVPKSFASLILMSFGFPICIKNFPSRLKEFVICLCLCCLSDICFMHSSWNRVALIFLFYLSFSYFPNF
jgi:hypothetical protein